ncbi:MAG: glycosyltransferase family 2 protein [Deltaproteobacteria bacterium]|nr:glycosyltransferase family 2 protein [Deltaproteobacteria bacterium]
MAGGAVSQRPEHAGDGRDEGTPELSIVVPVYNERATLAALVDECAAALAPLKLAWELIFIDDGSTDGSFGAITEMHLRDRRVRGVRLRTNLGKSAALAVGFRAARGSRLVTIDGDLQDDPREIPRLLAALDEGADLVSGWKTARQDPPARVLASRVFNGLSRLASGIALHDVNCGLKAYRREVAAEVPLYGELHRFIPLLAHWRGFRVAEIAVTHRPRAVGRSRYGWSRVLRGIMDLVTVICLTRYNRRPAHFFSLPGAGLVAIGLAICTYIAYLRLRYGHILQHHPLLIFGVLLVVVGVQLFTTGLLGEMMVDAGRRIDEDYEAARKL